jgi:hypothetical protein
LRLHLLSLVVAYYVLNVLRAAGQPPDSGSDALGAVRG